MGRWAKYFILKLSSQAAGVEAGKDELFRRYLGVRDAPSPPLPALIDRYRSSEPLDPWPQVQFMGPCAARLLPKLKIGFRDCRGVEQAVIDKPPDFFYHRR